jgi:hypothetical protein
MLAANVEKSGRAGKADEGEERRMGNGSEPELSGRERSGSRTDCCWGVEAHKGILDIIYHVGRPHLVVLR